MPFYKKLIAATEAARADFLTIPILQRALQGDIDKEAYIAFLAQAYHHVKHTVPLLMACGSRLPDHVQWLRRAIGEYIEEEMGHEEWILDDIAACGGDAATARSAPPSPATELMVAYAYDVIQRRNPVGFFGMVFVLEGTSVQLASRAAEALKGHLNLPSSAFRYLNSHGALDQGHIKFFESLMDRIESNEDQQSVIHCAQMFYLLYGNIFRGIAAAPQ
jgi:pyrroloquinoline quinone (PQQ) biosynthesis protein C